MFPFASGFARACLFLFLLLAAPAADADWRWLNPPQGGNPAKVLLHTQDRYLSIDASGGVMVSSDAVEWQRVRDGSPQDSVNDAVLRGSSIVAVGNHGSVLYSGDGQHWQRGNAATTANLRAVAAGPAGFVAVGKLSLLHSSDGLNWDLVDAGVQPGFFGPSFNEVSYGNGRYVVWIDPDLFGYSPFNVLTSADAKNWTRTTAVLTDSFSFSMLFVRSLAFVGDRFVATASDGASLASIDGIHWTTGKPPFFGNVPAFFRTMAFDATSQRYIALTDRNIPATPMPTYPQVFSSGDGLDWSNGQTLDRIPAEQLSAANGRVFGLCFPGGAVYEHLSDASWRARRSLPPAWRLLDVVTEGNTIVAVGKGPTRAVKPAHARDDLVPTVVWSSDGSFWISHSFEEGLATGSLDAVATGGGSLVAVGAVALPGDSTPLARQYPAAYVSRDGGQSWTRAALPRDDQITGLTDIAYAGGRFVAAARLNVFNRSTVLTSDDGGSTWEVRETGHGNAFSRIAAAGSGFIAAAASGDSIYLSADGMAWTAASTGSDAQTISAVAAHAGRYLAAASTSSSNVTAVRLFVSVDGTNWQQSTDSPPGVSQLLAGDEGFVAVTGDGDVATSADGLDWAVAWSGATTPLASAAQRSDGDLVLVTLNGSILAGSVDRVFRGTFD